jgi:hypothetical protein
VTHFLLLTYLSDVQQTQYLRDTTHCFPPMAIEKQQEFNRIVKQHFKLLVSRNFKTKKTIRKIFLLF